MEHGIVLTQFVCGEVDHRPFPEQDRLRRRWRERRAVRRNPEAEPGTPRLLFRARSKKPAQVGGGFSQGTHAARGRVRAPGSVRPGASPARTASDRGLSATARTRSATAREGGCPFPERTCLGRNRCPARGNPAGPPKGTTCVTKCSFGGVGVSGWGGKRKELSVPTLPRGGGRAAAARRTRPGGWDSGASRATGLGGFWTRQGILAGECSRKTGRVRQSECFVC